jgi:hypothetical protein
MNFPMNFPIEPVDLELGITNVTEPDDARRSQKEVDFTSELNKINKEAEDWVVSRMSQQWQPSRHD